MPRTTPSTSFGARPSAAPPCEILLVTQDETAGQMLRTHLRTRGFGVFGPVGLQHQGMFMRHTDVFGAAVIDLDAGDSAHDVIWRLNESATPCRSVLVGAKIDRQLVAEAFLVGVVACLPKPVDGRLLELATRRAVDCTTMMRACMQLADGDPEPDGLTPEPAHIDLGALTPRERQVLDLVLDGESTDTMADRLGISSRTVKYHVGNLLRKLGVRSRMALLAKLRARGLG